MIFRRMLGSLSRARTLLPQVGLSLLDAGHDHIARASGRQPVQPRAPADDGDAVEVLRAGVVGAVHHRGHWETQRHAELVPARTSLFGSHTRGREGGSAREPPCGFEGLGFCSDDEKSAHLDRSIALACN